MSRCQARESGGIQCELPEGHEEKHACPKALSDWMLRRNFLTPLEQIAAKAEEAGDKIIYVDTDTVITVGRGT